MGCKPSCASKDDEKDCISIVYTVNSPKLPESILKGLAFVLNNPLQGELDFHSPENEKESPYRLFSYCEESSQSLVDKKIQSVEECNLAKTMSRKSLRTENDKQKNGKFVLRKSLSQNFVGRRI